MDSNNVLRLALMLSSTQTHTFKKNLNKLTKLILFDSYAIPIQITTIISNIKSVFSLEFTEAEILMSIKDDAGIIIHEEKDPVKSTYEITPDEYQKISLSQDVNIELYLTEFLKLSPDLFEFSFEDAKNIIYKFIYITFNSDTQTLLELMDKSYTDKKDYCIAKEFSSDEAALINEFLNWDYKPKNEFILNLISSCFDYCMLTVKKDNNSYANVFSGKIFYLDSNIIFRLAGFNKVERQSVMNSFINKCKDANIKICYTNHTYSEIKNTIKYHVDSIKSMFSKNRPLSLKAMQVMSSKYANLDFYEKYVEWCKENPSLIGDFESFRVYLEGEIKKVVHPFELKVFDDKDTFKNHTAFSELFDDFNQYKLERYKNTYEGAIKTDINNYLYMTGINNDIKATNFMQLKYYFITADHCLTEWASLKRPGTIPLFVLPSVWYSILLKYKGRSDDDYNAFCQFLNIRIVPEKDIHIVEKKKMLAYILTINEDSDIKERVVFDIESRLSNMETSIDDPIAFAEESHQTILQEKLLEQKAEDEKKNEKDLQKLREKLEATHQSQMECLETEKDELAKKERDTGYLEGQSNIIEKEALRIKKRNESIQKTLDIIFIIGLVILLACFCCFLFIKEDMSNKFTVWYEANAATIAIITGIVTILSKILKKIFESHNILETNKEKIIEKLNERYK